MPAILKKPPQRYYTSVVASESIEHALTCDCFNSRIYFYMLWKLCPKHTVNDKRDTHVLPSDKIARLKDLFLGSWVPHFFRTNAWLSQDPPRIACGRECLRVWEGVRVCWCVFVTLVNMCILCKWMLPQSKKTKSWMLVIKQHTILFEGQSRCPHNCYSTKLKLERLCTWSFPWSRRNFVYECIFFC